MNRRNLGPALAAALAGSLFAQQDADQRTHAEMARTQRELQQNRSDLERLIARRMQHDFGLPGEDDPANLRPATPVTTEARDRLLQEWRDQDAATASLAERYNKLRGMVDSLRADAVERAKAPRDDGFVVVPQAGTAQGSQQRRAPVEAVDQPRAPAAGSPPAPARDVLGERDPIRGQIHGSRDHLRVAQSLFKAGQALLDRAAEARAHGQTAAAVELDARAKERLVRALDELKPLLADKEPAFPALFFQGRCRELLFRLAERQDGLSLVTSAKDYQKREQEVRDPFVAISARDVSKTGTRGDVEVLGAWGMAAQAAVEHFRWMNLHGGYKPRTPIESLTWPGEKNQ